MCTQATTVALSKRPQAKQSEFDNSLGTTILWKGVVLLHTTTHKQGVLLRTVTPRMLTPIGWCLSDAYQLFQRTEIIIVAKTVLTQHNFINRSYKKRRESLKRRSFIFIVNMSISKWFSWNIESSANQRIEYIAISLIVPFGHAFP